MLVEAGIDPEKNHVQIMPIPGAAGPNVSFGLSAAKALEEGTLDGFWANGMGCEVAVRRGVGTMVLDVRRGDGPTVARHYTFSALVATDKTIKDNPAAARAAIRAMMKAHKALKQDPNRATAVGQKRFPPSEAELIAELVRRDLPYYDPTIPPEKVESMNRFAQDIGLLKAPAAYDQVVARQNSRTCGTSRCKPGLRDNFIPIDPISPRSSGNRRVIIAKSWRRTRPPRASVKNAINTLSSQNSEHFTCPENTGRLAQKSAKILFVTNGTF